MATVNPPAVVSSACQIPLTNFVWYTGRYNTSTGAEGYWQFFDPAIEGGDQTSVRIDYTYTDESHRSLDVENKRTDGHENAGDTIAYALAGADLTLAVHDESESLDYTAGIDVNTDAGYIQVPNYNNGEKACWDENQLNADCL